VNLLRLISGSGWGADGKSLLQLYKQFIRPVLESGSVATAKAKNGAIHKLEIVERRALRAVLQVGRYTRNEDLYALTGIVPIKERNAELRRNAIQRFGYSKGIQELKQLKELMGAESEDQSDIDANESDILSDQLENQQQQQQQQW
jgi:hypothetical protein